MEEVLVRHAYQNRNVPMRVNVGDVWLDLGANIGTFTLGVVGFGGTVVAVECEESNLGLLAENVALNGFEDSVTVVPKAVSMEEGEVELFVCTARRNTYRHSLKMVKNREPVPVQSTTLATLLTDHPNINAIKLDIEGAEMEILESLDASVVANVQKIVFEWTFDYDPDIPLRTSRPVASQCTTPANSRCGIRCGRRERRAQHQSTRTRGVGCTTQR
jgi:FkbM family methyltransferase